jgi:hypothetical protein
MECHYIFQVSNKFFKEIIHAINERYSNIFIVLILLKCITALGRKKIYIIEKKKKCVSGGIVLL